MPEFTCNICGARNRHDSAAFDREASNCSGCGSNVRVRGLIRVLSLELFGVALTLPEFPRVKSLRGIGMTDFGPYAERLAEKFDYKNTFYDRAPQLDICNPPPEDLGRYDFIISSEVFEHTICSPAVAFRKANEILKPGGVLVLSVPYSVEPSMAEHFSDLHEFGLARVGNRTVLVNRKADGQLQVFENLTFHGKGPGKALEMREFNEPSLRQILVDAGFPQVQVYADNDPDFGVIHAQSWSLPIGARKQPFALASEPIREIMQSWASQTRLLQAERNESAAQLTQTTASLMKLANSKWSRLGKKLGLL